MLTGSCGSRIRVADLTPGTASVADMRGWHEGLITWGMSLAYTRRFRDAWGLAAS